MGRSGEIQERGQKVAAECVPWDWNWHALDNVGDCDDGRDAGGLDDAKR